VILLGQCDIALMPREPKFKPKYIGSIKRWAVNVPANLSSTDQRSRRFFKTQEDASIYADSLKDQKENLAKDYASLSRLEQNEALEAFRRLKASGRPYHLLSIVEEWLVRQTKESPSKSFLEVTDEALDMKINRKKIAAPYQEAMRALRNQVAQSGLSKRQLSGINAVEIEEWLEDKDYSETTYNRVLRQLHTIFRYAVRQRYLPYNLIDGLEPFELGPRTVRVFSNQAIRDMLDNALKTDIQFVPYFAIGAFTGMRIAGELVKLQWSDIHLDSKEIVVRAEISKTKDRRFLPITPNLEAWLRVYFEKAPFNQKGRVMKFDDYQNLYRARKALCANWVPNGLRKTFASAMINKGEDISLVCRILGHRANPDKLWNYYHKSILEPVAKAYWEIYPAGYEPKQKEEKK
jgi:integrase